MAAGHVSETLFIKLHTSFKKWKKKLVISTTKKQGEQGPKQSIQFNSLLIFTLHTVSAV